ncbi:MAG: DUF2860 domain-containing protein [Deltaproteobacteria bacterium]|nr:DUF2860 domain-containing protein [Deltaproteobacteria bacterium]
MKKTMFVLCFTLLTFMAITALAQEGNMPKENNFSARIEAGGIWINTTDQLFVYDRNEKTENLNDEADNFSTTMPLVMFDLRYAFQSSDTEVYLQTPLEESGIPLTLGLTQTFIDTSKLDVSIFYGIMGEVWKDPYIAGGARDDTDIKDVGFTIDYDRILDTGLNLYYRYNLADVDEDVIGTRFHDLKRDGIIHTTGLGYMIDLDENNMIIPGFEYSKANMDGESNSYNSYKIKFGYKRMKNDYILNAFVSADKKDYDKTHPIFNKTRDETEYSATAIFTLLNPFGYDKFFTNFIVGYSYSDSNIDFFDKRTYISGVTIGYNF